MRSMVTPSVARAVFSVFGMESKTSYNTNQVLLKCHKVLGEGMSDMPQSAANIADAILKNDQW
jgi:hypothetical protein